MKSPTVKYNRIGILPILAFVLAVFAIAAAQNDSEDSAQMDVLATQPEGSVAQELNEDTWQNNDPVAQAADPPTQEPNEVSNQENAPMTLKQRLLKTISIDCTNTPIEDVIKMLAEQADVDIIKSPAVTGSVTAKLTNVPLEEALNNILAVNGYGCVIDKNMIRIAPADEIAQKGEVLESRVYRITYADAAQVERTLRQFISKRGSISSNLGTSNIIVTDTSSSIRAIDAFIDEIDRITPQLIVEVRIYDVTSTDGFDLSPEWHVARNYPITLVGTGDQSTTWQESSAGEDTPSYTYKKSNPFVGGSYDSETGGVIRFGILDSINVEFALSILKSEIGAKLLANPRILVLDNETAEFKIISEIPYTETSQTSSGGSMTSIQFKDVGVELRVTPHVTRDGMIRLHIMPEFGVVAEKGKTLASGVQTVPTVDTRKLDTKALVKDGQTVVLGGLRRRTVAQTVKKVPILGDAPIVGGLFSDVSEEVKTNELLIFITPIIVTDMTLSPKELRNYKATNFSDPRRFEVGDERVGEVEEDAEAVEKAVDNAEEKSMVNSETVVEAKTDAEEELMAVSEAEFWAKEEAELEAKARIRAEERAEAEAKAELLQEEVEK